ncbi:Hsp20/alpha crystallin family protein [Thiohalocapsa sp.]|jgi:HSP20 family molecular chaperone IbpA|uniref:Hsp20/alpha crystallin family protein n=1 Tax=Thiohalocapsa sp. TaxID=2497641 RepID=UPI0025D6F111|nr:Hsp20/alpha crystallin family protein [Thiohalocapsa sp.]
MNAETSTTMTDTPGTTARAVQDAMRPPVDIFEDAEGITLEADMPGVSKDRLHVQVDANTLLIEGEVQIDLPDTAEAVYADVRSTRWRRSFTLSNELEADKIDASLRDGVLRLRIPKHPQQRPRRIEVRATG